jgi:outer membrane immunogenic protein
MRGLFVAAAFVAFSVTSAQTASAAPPSPPVPSWTGWYIGLNAGGVWGGDPVGATASNSQFCPTGLCGKALDFANASIQGATGEFPAKAGFMGGGQFGYNLQLADRWIAGFEADFQGLVTDAGGSDSRYSAADVSGFAGHGVGTDLSVTKRIDFLGTVRGRLGYLVVPRLLVFGTGGFAYGHVKSGLTISQSLIGSGLGGLEARPGTALSTSRIQAGWTLGGGFEWMFASNWTAKIEYLYYDLGKVTSNGQIADRITSPAPPTTYYFVNDVQSTTRFNGNIVRAGLNYHY